MGHAFISVNCMEVYARSKDYYFKFIFWSLRRTPSDFEGFYFVLEGY